MWITQAVNLPDALVDAQRDGKLVVFAGAGVSMGAPANFPNFKGLAREIGAGSLEPQKDEPEERYLGRLADMGVRVHERAQELLGDPRSRPTPLHCALVSLFAGGDALRIITTNFDRHFTTVCRARFAGEFEQYCAPAVPLGRVFDGLVYLHGSIDKRPTSMVLTDKDFGRAYLTDGWAARFLAEMFPTHTVLFVGYSHNDPVMSYLARGLPPNTQRYALTQPDQDEHWTFLGITPILYPLADGDDRHATLTQAVEAWSRLARMGALDHERRVREIVELPPPVEPDSVDYIARALKDPVMTRFFTRYARGKQWLRWTETKGLLTALFQQDVCQDEVALELAEWFAQCFVCDESDEALALVERNQGVLTPRLWSSISRQLFRDKKRMPPAVLAKWVAILVNSTPRHQRPDFLGFLLEACHYPEDAYSALLLFDYLTEPRLSGNGVKTIGEEHWLRKAWNESMKPELALLAQYLEPIITHHLTSARVLLMSVGSGNDRGDMTSYGRSAIEPHEQDRHREGFDTLIDAARDILEWMLVNAPQRGRAVIDAWGDSGVPLIERLAIHGVAVNMHQNPDEKIAWLLQKDWLFRYGLKHEVFRLLELAYSGASEASRRSLLDRVACKSRRDVSDERDRDLQEYEKYNVLVWLNRVAPDCGAAKRELTVMQASHPDFGPREHPDSYGWVSSWSRIGAEGPIELASLLGQDPGTEVKWLLEFQGDEFRGPSREGLLTTVSQAVTQSFAWGWGLVSALAGAADWETDLWPAIIHGWQGASLTEVEWEQTLNFVNQHSQLLQHAHPLLNWLVSGLTAEPSTVTPHCLPLLESLTDHLWDWAAEASPGDTVFGDLDWLAKAINHPGGKIAEVWLQVLAHRVEVAAGARTGLSDDSRTRLETVVAGASYTAEMGRVVLASQVHFLFDVDQGWTREHVVPLFDWTKDQRRAEQAWHGYLLWGRWSEPLLANLLPYYEQTFTHLAAFPDRLRDRFCLHLAEIAIFSSSHPAQYNWIREFLLSTDPVTRALWATHIGQRLDALDAAAAEEQWNRWIDGYWDRRNQGIPVPLSDEEKAAMISWATGLSPVFPAVVERICELPASTSEHSSIYDGLLQSRAVSDHPSATARLLSHVLRSTQQPFYYFDEVVKLLRSAAGAGAPRNVLVDACEQLARLGYPKTAELLDFIEQGAEAMQSELHAAESSDGGADPTESRT